jgi:hypothetical protein
MQQEGRTKRKCIEETSQDQVNENLFIYLEAYK